MKKIFIVMLICAGCILAFFIITNPSVRSFKEYLGHESYGGLQRNKNYLIYSTFSFREEKYIGVVSNFFPIVEELYAVDTIVVEEPPIEKITTSSQLYGFLKTNHLTTKTESEFMKTYSNKNKAKELYDFFVTNNLTDKSFEYFYNQYFTK